MNQIVDTTKLKVYWTVYWIHLPHETDPLTEGYVGITKRDLYKRFSEHKRDKSLSDDYMIDTLHICETEKEAFVVEEYYRPIEDIGLNKNRGGDSMPYPTMPRHQDWRDAIGKSNSKPKIGAALAAARANQKKATAARIGSKDNQEVKRKRSQSLKDRYKSNPEIWARPQYKKLIVAEGIRYLGVQECADAHGVSRVTVYNRIKSNKWDWGYG